MKCSMTRREIEMPKTQQIKTDNPKPMNTQEFLKLKTNLEREILWLISAYTEKVGKVPDINFYTTRKNTQMGVKVK